MRLRQASLFAVLAVGIMSFCPAWAGNVLLPPDDGNGGGAPNLGLSPSLPEAPQPAPKDTAPKPKDKPEALPPAPAPVLAPLPTPVPPTQPLVPPNAPQQSFNLGIALADNSIGTSSDIQTISEQLGIPVNLVRAECRIGLSGLLVTDRGTIAVDSDGNTHVTASYSGTVVNAILSTQAVCHTAPKPSPNSYVQRIGDQFAITLGSAFCTPAMPFEGTKTRLTITHTATGNDTCLYQ